MYAVLSIFLQFISSLLIRDLLLSFHIYLNILGTYSIFNNQYFLGVLTLPNPTYLEKLTSAFKVDGGTVEGDIPETTKQYLKTRIVSLNERQKTVNLIFDEVYNARRVEYSGGKFYGYENQQVTKTLLGVMIKSVAGKFHDMVALVPISKVDAYVLDKLWHKVLKVIDANIFYYCCAYRCDLANSNF